MAVSEHRPAECVAVQRPQEGDRGDEGRFLQEEAAMIILLEGPDGAGKSSLASALALRLGPECRIVHTGPPKPGEVAMVSYSRAVREACGRGGYTVFDRLHVGELVYGPILRGGSQLTTRQASDLCLAIQAVGGVLVHVTASIDTLLARRGSEVDRLSGAGPEVAQAVWVSYRALLGNTSRRGILSGRWLTVDTDTISSVEAAEAVVEGASDNNRQRRAR